MWSASSSVTQSLYRANQAVNPGPLARGHSQPYTLAFCMQHLYLHVPFCVRRCSYCDFSIAVRKRIPAREFVDVILAEARGTDFGEIETLYFGGGTPSLLPPDAISTLAHDLTSLRRTPHAAREVTLEANPEDVTPDNARAWRAAGVNRVSLGAQSFDDGVLKWMHRSHDAARIGAAVHALRGAGIGNISLDLIFGLPTEMNRDWERDLEMAVALRPTHLSLYGLTIEPRTPLDRWISRGATQIPDDERYAEEYLAAHGRLMADGYEFYEVSNASLPGFRSRHNSAYWSGKPYVGLGPAAHSFDGRTRRWNLRAWEAYRRAISEGRSVVESEETLTDEQQRLERVYLALRTSEGLPLTAPYRPLPPFTDQGWIEVRDGRLKCTPEGWLRLDSIVNNYDSATH
jgi:oxygen-independent coproporphyrinogen III oxidase